MNERKVELPSGGTAWIATVWDHRQATVMRRTHYRLRRYTNRDGEWREDLTREEQDEKDELVLEATALHVRTLVRRWENVRSPAGDELSFPDDVERMAEPDIQAIVAAIGNGEASPNA